MSDSVQKIGYLKALLDEFESLSVGQSLVIQIPLSEQNIQKVGEHASALGEVLEVVEVDGVYRELDELRTYIGQEAVVNLDYSDLRSSGIPVFSDWDDFLKRKVNIINVPDSFYIYTGNVIYPSSDETHEVGAYLDITKFLGILISHADHSTSLSSSVVKDVVFLHKSRIDINLEYGSSDLESSLDGITIIRDLFEDESHQEQKKSILKEALHGLLVNICIQDRLSYLIRNFGEFSKRLNENYQLFVSDFSFDEVRKEYEESKREYMVKLNDVFSSVQTKLLGIPVALAIAATKFSAIKDLESSITNLFILFAIIAYVIMMHMLIKNQGHTLNAVRDEYTSQMQRLEYQYVGENPDIANIFKKLNKRYDHQKSNLVVFYFLIYALLLLSIVFFIANLPWESLIKGTSLK